ncbi:z-protein, putative [Ixodes scapularis]|uniref:Z-protein, putative n=1 Tax=Ixodes scapularis TaxID=6945 RepID=B7QFX9_IXOSC|nr:z-protein, putative [Ixodes scapularis]|eukprot:XP_002401042.1 z-protein, putative [Ixodes scapularis]
MPCVPRRSLSPSASAGFLRKVYGILSVQFFLTTVITAITMFTPAAKLYISQNHWMVTGAFFMSLILLVLLMVKRRQTPTNYILLTAFVSHVRHRLCTACNHLVPGSREQAVLYAFLMVLVVGGLLQFVVASSHLELVLSLAGAALFSFFLIFDTHMIMHRVSPEEYILATIELYLDVVNLFLHILRIVGEARRH